MGHYTSHGSLNFAYKYKSPTQKYCTSSHILRAALPMCWGLAAYLALAVSAQPCFSVCPKAELISTRTSRFVIIPKTVIS